MECIPAIDLKGGKCVRLTQGKFEQQNLYSDDPLTIAKRWVSEGATRLHIIDLDGARTGMPSPEHVVIVRDIMRRLNVPVQLGGGIRNGEVIERMLGAGVDRVIIGTAALSDPTIDQLFQTYGDRIALGVDARDGMVAVDGWAEQTQYPALAFAKGMEKIGARRIIFTDIGRDGMLQGVNLDAVREMIGAVGIPVIAAGGVTTTQDVVDLKNIGAEGAVLGKALYENTLRLPDAIAAASLPIAGNARGAMSQEQQQFLSHAPHPANPPHAPATPLPPTTERPVVPPAAPGTPAAPAKPYLPWANPPKR